MTVVGARLEGRIDIVALSGLPGCQPLSSCGRTGRIFHGSDVLGLCPMLNQVTSSNVWEGLIRAERTYVDPLAVRESLLSSS
jgi:hypothetical protein